MCFGDAQGARAAAPAPAPGPATDPITLAPVDEVTITTLVDNTFDGLLTPTEGVERVGLGYPVDAPAFESGSTLVGLTAEHGFSALVRVRRGERTSTLLFDTGLSPRAMVDNADRMEVRFDDVQATVLSHGHFDHAGGLAALAERRGTSMPLTLHPHVWARRRLALPGVGDRELPTLSRQALIAEGFEVIERRVPSVLLDGCVLITARWTAPPSSNTGCLPPIRNGRGGSGFTTRWSSTTRP